MPPKGRIFPTYTFEILIVVGRAWGQIRGHFNTEDLIGIYQAVSKEETVLFKTLIKTPYCWLRAR